MTTPTLTGISLPQRLLDTVLDKETDFDGTLPEFCPDVVRLIRVDCTPYVDGCTANGERASITGRILYDILYESDRKRKLRFCNFVQDFTHVCDLPKNDLEALRCECSATCCRITCKMLSPRHFSLHARLELRTVVTGERQIPMLSAEPAEGVFIKPTRFTYDAPAETVTSETPFCETLSLLQGEKNIGEPVFSGITLQPPQVSVTSGSATAKTNAVVKLFYESEENGEEYCMSVKNVPISVTVESPSIGEDRHTALSLAISAQSVTPDLDQYGESRIIKAEFSVKATAVSVETLTAETAEDLFTRDSEEVFETTRLVIPELEETLDRSFTVDLKITPDEPLFTSVYDSNVRVGRIRAGLAEGGVEVDGTVTLSVLGEAGDGIQHRDYTEEFRQFIPVDLPRHISGVMVEVSPFEVLPTLHSDGSISARIICNARLFLYTEEQATFLSGISEQKELPEESDLYSVAYFFPSGEDSLWSIAKRYRVDPASVLADNPSVFGEGGTLPANAGPVLVKKG